MRNNVFVPLLLIGGLLIMALQPAPSGTPTSVRIQAYFQACMNSFDASIAQFIAALEAQDNQPAKWQTAYARMRNHYKQMEFLIAYLDEENAKDYFNGAPLPSVNRVVAQVEVMPPAGMQIIEEALFGEAPLDQRSFILDRAQEMRERFLPVSAVLHQLPITDRQILEAIRAGIFRITTLGITGFDTPGSGRALHEAAIGLEAIGRTTMLYADYLPSGRKSLADSLSNAFSGAIDFLKRNDDFDTFDRMTFIRTWMEPLYRLTLNLHLALGVETIYEVTNLSKPLNYLSGSMFATATLNDHYYAGIGAAKESPDVIALGKLLFFDPILSSDNKMACASCHQPALAFTDGQPKSKAAGNQGTLSRNAPTIINSVYADKFFYDLRSDRLENQAEHVILNAREFNTTYYEMMEKLNQSSHYQRLFLEAFQKPVNIQDVSRALAAYVRSLTSFDSPVDKYLRGEIGEIPDEEVRAGFNLFMGKAACATCHFPPTYAGLVPPSFAENESEVIGVPADPKADPLQIDPDPGRYANGRPRDRAPHLQFGFKTTTVRNVALTAPYMHNGVYTNLEEVVDFYNRGGGAGMGLDIPHQTLPFDNLNLSPLEQRSLVKFMEALTDTAGLTTTPMYLPAFEHKPEWNARPIGGSY